MNPPIPIPHIIMQGVMLCSVSMILFSPPVILIIGCLILLYVTAHLYIVKKHKRHYKHSQYYALYKTPFHQLIKHTTHYKQYIIYQTLLHTFADDSDILISHTPYTILLLHPSGIYLWNLTQNPKNIQKIIQTYHVTSLKDTLTSIQMIQSQVHQLTPQELMHLYDTIIRNKAIPYF